MPTSGTHGTRGTNGTWGINGTTSINGTNNTTGINNCVLFGGIYSVDMMFFNQKRNQKMIKFEYVKKGATYHTL